MGHKEAVIFELDNGLYGIDIMEVNEIIRMVHVTPLPHTDRCIEGIINLRGQIIPVINLCCKLGLNSSELDNDNRIIVIHSGDRQFGMIVDRVLEVGSYDDADLSTINDVGIDDALISEVVRREDQLWIILKLQNLN